MSEDPHDEALRRRVAELEARVRELEGASRLAGGSPAATPIEDGSRVIADVVPSPLYVYSLVEGRNLWANAAHRDLFGGLFGDSDEESILAVVHPDDVAVLRTSQLRIQRLANRERLDREYRIRFPDGSWRWFVERCAVFRRDHEGGVLEFIGCATDVTDDRLAEEALRDSEARFRAVFESAAAGIALVGPDGEIIDVNEYICTFFGRPRERLRGVHFRELTHPDDVERDETLYAELMAGRRQSYSMRKRYQAAGGDVRWGELSVSLIRSPNGTPGYSVAVLRDMTDQQLAEMERERLLEEVRGLGHRLAEVQEEERRHMEREIHDRLGSSLTVLSLDLGHVRSSLPEDADPDLARHLGECLELVAETGAVVRDVMTELQPPDLVDYGLRAALRAHCERMAARIELPVQVRGPDPHPRPPPVVEIALFRIAQEALINAARHAAADHVEVALQDDGTTLELTVADDGRGFDHATTAAPGCGGWGLTTMRERASAVGAVFEVESAPGYGCRVHVTYTRGRDADPRDDRR